MENVELAEAEMIFFSVKVLGCKKQRWRKTLMELVSDRRQREFCQSYGNRGKLLLALPLVLRLTWWVIMRSHANLIKNVNNSRLHLPCVHLLLLFPIRPHGGSKSQIYNHLVTVLQHKQTFMTREPKHNNNLIYLSSPKRADKAKQLEYHVCQEKMLWSQQDDECSSFVQSSSWSVWNHLLTSHAGSCVWLETGHLRNMPITTSPEASSLMTDFAYAASNQKDNTYIFQSASSVRPHAGCFPPQLHVLNKHINMHTDSFFHLCSKVK